MRFIRVAVLMLSLSSSSFAQNISNYSQGELFFQWGWNQSQYAPSDIHFTGPGYDFTLHDVRAKDRPTHFKPEIYFNPTTITIPQTNFKIGYFISDNWSVSLGYDHMKYVATQYQTVDISGDINAGTNFDGTYDRDPIQMTYSLLKYEHTDGLNYFYIGADYYSSLLRLSDYGVARGNIEVLGSFGFDAGAVVPKTNAQLFQMERSDRFHLAGYGAAVNMSLNIAFFKYFYLGAQVKPGFIHLPDVQTTLRDSDRASQRILYIQENLYLGIKLHL
ncbi:MAG: hypothetical protein HWE14_01290 [Flavobacteriia bacterium]|nr:hypothetical protein [Flavobacteriia bacterium]